MQFSGFITLPEKTKEVNLLPDIKLRAEVIFGISSQGCRGTGICKLTTLSGFDKKEKNRIILPCKKALVEITKSSTGKLHFQFEKNTLCKNIQAKNFQSGYFFIQEDFPLPILFQKQLQSFGKIIYSGFYPVIETKDCFTVIF